MDPQPQIPNPTNNNTTTNNNNTSNNMPNPIKKIYMKHLTGCMQIAKNRFVADAVVFPKEIYAEWNGNGNQNNNENIMVNSNDREDQQVLQPRSKYSYNRIYRAKNQQIHILQVRRDPHHPHPKPWHFLLQSPTLNTYHLTISTKCTCTCPDYTTNSRTCKHIYFLIAVLIGERRMLEYVTEDGRMDELVLDLIGLEFLGMFGRRDGVRGVGGVGEKGERVEIGNLECFCLEYAQVQEDNKEEQQINKLPILQIQPKSQIPQQNTQIKIEPPTIPLPQPTHPALRTCPNCHKIFHKTCLQLWLRQRSNCPNCRGFISFDARYDPLRELRWVQLGLEEEERVGLGGQGGGRGWLGVGVGGYMILCGMVDMFYGLDYCLGQ